MLTTAFTWKTPCLFPFSWSFGQIIYILYFNCLDFCSANWLANQQLKFQTYKNNSKWGRLNISTKGFCLSKYSNFHAKSRNMRRQSNFLSHLCHWVFFSYIYRVDLFAWRQGGKRAALQKKRATRQKRTVCAIVWDIICRERCVCRLGELCLRVGFSRSACWLVCAVASAQRFENKGRRQQKSWGVKWNPSRERRRLLWKRTNKCKKTHNTTRCALNSNTQCFTAASAHTGSSQPSDRPTERPTNHRQLHSHALQFKYSLPHTYTHTSAEREIEKSMPGAADLAQRATILFFLSVCIKSFSPPADSQLLRGYARRQTTASTHWALMLEMWPDETIFLLELSVGASSLNYS